MAAAFADWRHFDIIHDHTRFFSTLFAHLVPIPIVSTVHHPVEFDELHWHHQAAEYATFFRRSWERLVKSVTTVFVSQFQRACFSGKAHVIHKGIPLTKWSKGSFAPGRYLAFLEAINGPVNFEQKQRFLADAKAVLMPIQWDDPFPTVALEPLASGTPVIAWNRSSMGEIIEDGKTGFLVSSVEEMAARIRDIGRIDRRSCRSRAELLFDSKLMAANYVDFTDPFCASLSNKTPGSSAIPIPNLEWDLGKDRSATRFRRGT